jgi:hypothetical protein
VSVDTDVTDLTRAYWRRARALHPDRSSDPEATQQFQALHAAYRLLVEAALQSPAAAVAPARAGTGDHESTDRASSRSRQPSPIRVTRRPDAADDGVWVVAGPVHVHPASQPSTTPRTRAEGNR